MTLYQNRCNVIHMEHTTATAAAISSAASSAGVSMREIASRTGIAYTTLWRKMRGLASFTVEDIARIASVLNVAPTALVRFAEAA